MITFGMMAAVLEIYSLCPIPTADLMISAGGSAFCGGVQSQPQHIPSSMMAAILVIQ